MGHRNTLNPPQILDTESHQGRNHTVQPYILMGRTSTPGSSSFVHPGENIYINGGPFPSPWTAPRSRINSSSIPNVEMPCFQQQAPGPSCDPFVHQPVGGNFQMVPDSNSRLPSSSILNGQTVPEAHGSFVNQTTMDSSRGPYKRKSPNHRQLHDRGSASRYYDAGSSSNFLLPTNPWQENQNAEFYNMPWQYGPAHRVNSLSIGGEGMQRNVRRRTVVDQDPNRARTHLTNNHLHCTFPPRPCDQSNAMVYSGQSSNISTRDWNHHLISPAGHGGIGGANSSSFGQGPSTLNAQHSFANVSVESSYSNNASTPQNDNGYLNQSRREVQSSHHQGPAPPFRASSNNFYTGQVAASGEGPVIAAENFPSRHSQAFSTLEFPYGERNMRTGMSNVRFRSFAQGSSVPNRAAPQVIAVNCSIGSITLFDQHRGMRLDVDNMSYEELLALGERIGSVSTGLSDGLISNCLTQSIYGSSDQFQDGRRCVICLEEYKHMDDVGTLRCGHDYHVDCIREWLSIKNLCPICKASAIDDTREEPSS